MHSFNALAAGYVIVVARFNVTSMVETFMERNGERDTSMRNKLLLLPSIIGSGRRGEGKYEIKKKIKHNKYIDT